MHDDLLDRRTIAGYAAGSVGTGGFSTLPGLVLAYYLTDTLGVPALLATVAVIVPKIWDVAIAPAVGSISDAEARRRGTRSGLMLLGALTLPVGFTLTFAAPASLSPAAAALWVIVAFVLAATSFSLFQVPYIALPADLTRHYDERTRLMAWRIATLALTILLVGAGGPALRDLAGGGPRGYLVMSVIVAAVLLAGMLATIVAVRGRTLPLAPGPAAGHGGLRAGIRALREHRDYRNLLIVFVLQATATGVMLAAAQYVAAYTLGNQAALTFLFVALIAPALLVMPLWHRYAARVGKARGLRLASVVFIGAALALLLIPVLGSAWAYLAVAVAGVAYAGMQLFPLAMLPDVISRAGRERGGAMSGLWTAGETAGLASGPAIVLLMLAAGGFVSSRAGDAVTQPASALTAIVLAFAVLPALLVAISLLALRSYDDPGTAEKPSGATTDPTP